MDLKEIVLRSNSIPVTDTEMCFVVQEYIKEKKSVSVDINLMKRLNTHDPFFQHEYLDQANKLIRAYNVASGYFLTKMGLDMVLYSAPHVINGILTAYGMKRKMVMPVFNRKTKSPHV